MTDDNGSGQPTEVEKVSIPEVPPARTFSVRLPDVPDPTTGVPTQDFETVEAHQIEITAHGDLLFFEFSFVLTTQGYQPNSQMRRALAEGQWLGLREVMRPKSGIIFH